MQEKPNDKIILSHIRRLVAHQKKDEGLFFRPVYASEAYLQKALRELHCVIKGDIYFKTLSGELCKKR